jgi:hypothetical protein
MKPVDYGPLRVLIGTWKGEFGSDLVPKSYGEKTNRFTETLIFSPAGYAENIDKELLVALRYHTHIIRLNDGKDIHDQVGYYLWNPDNDVLMHSFTLPRGMAVLCGGSYKKEDSTTVFDFNSEQKGERGIIQSSFLSRNSKVESFSMQLVVDEVKMTYEQHTGLHVFGKEFDHLDKNTLFKQTV